jgi:hypothetical protein
MTACWEDIQNIKLMRLNNPWMPSSCAVEFSQGVRPEETNLNSGLFVLFGGKSFDL